MSERRHVAKVSIVGEEYSIRSDATPEHTRAVAAYLDREIRKVLGGNALMEPHKAAILAAMQITDELFKERKSAREVEEHLLSLGAEVRRWLPPGKRGEGAEE
ncbi:MAG TPA: cell division protein ZapA [Gemmatimonadaceae bacterium]